MVIYRYFTISGRDKQLKIATDHNSVLTWGNLWITNRRTLGSWSCQTWSWGCIFLSFAGTGKWEGSQLPAQSQTQQGLWGWWIQFPFQPPSLSLNQMLKKKKKSRGERKNFETPESFTGERNKPCILISQHPRTELCYICLSAFWGGWFSWEGCEDRPCSLFTYQCRVPAANMSVIFS